MGRVLSIGWDVGGWQGKKNAFSGLSYDGKSFQWSPPILLKVPDNPGLFTIDAILNSLKYSQKSYEKLIIAIDAPLGIPKDFLPFLKGTFDFIKPTSGISNRIAFRCTDRYVHRITGKPPLSPLFDKMGINTTLVLAHLKQWKKDGFQVRTPNCKSYSLNEIIEVYPAMVKSIDNISLEKKKILLLLQKLNDNKIISAYNYYQSIGTELKTDQLDSALCAILGMSAILCHQALPKLDTVVPEEFFSEIAYTAEGWIYSLPITK